jgi:mono/diheme cytochrome c family protein
MKRGTIWFVVFLAAVAAAAGSLVYAQFDAGYYSQKNLGAIMQPAAPKETDGATYAVTAYPLYTPELAPGPGREEVQSYCSTCHSTRYIIMQPPLPPETWAAEVNKIESDGPAHPRRRATRHHQVFADALRSRNPQALVHLR